MSEDRDITAKCLRQLRNYLIDDEDLKVPIHDEHFLIRFVRNTNYDAESAFTMVKKYFKFRQKNAKLFKMAFPSHPIVKMILKANSLLKHKDPMGRSIIIFNNPSWEVRKFNLDHIAAAFVLLVEELLSREVELQINGIVIILNLKNLSLEQVQEWSIRRIKYALDIFQGSIPVRCKRIHVINQPKILDFLLTAVKPFTTDNFTKMFSFHGQGLENLHEKIPTEILPYEYGGRLAEDEAYNKNFYKLLLPKDNYYKKLQAYGYGNCEYEPMETKKKYQ